ncbi:MAG: hypothetical protein AAF447_21955 [Myxococcota bacterium]
MNERRRHRQLGAVLLLAAAYQASGCYESTAATGSSDLSDLAVDSAMPSDLGVRIPREDAGADGGSDAGRDAGRDGSTSDASTGDANTGDASTVCQLRGSDWAAEGGFLRFEPDGTFAAAFTRSGLDSAVTGGTYTEVGNDLTLIDHGGTPCGAIVGRYTTAFTPGCRRVTLTLVTDACDSRSVELTGRPLEAR